MNDDNGRYVGGFTIIEVVITMFILEVAFLGITSMTDMVINGNSFGKMITAATVLANDKLEDLKPKSFTDTDMTAGSHSDAGNPFNGLYTRTWIIADALDAANVKVMYKTIAMTVTWTWKRNSHSVSLNTLQANSR
jgi:Tfp pilus assembly protein PilV